MARTLGKPPKLSKAKGAPGIPQGNQPGPVGIPRNPAPFGNHKLTKKPGTGLKP